MPHFTLSEVFLAFLLPCACTAARLQTHSIAAEYCRCRPQPLAKLAGCTEGYRLVHGVHLPGYDNHSTVVESRDAAKHQQAQHLLGCCVPASCPSTPFAQPDPEATPTGHSGPVRAAAEQEGPTAYWMFQCCSGMLLREMFLPGTHDSGTYMWTTPKHMPMVLDEILTILFNIVGDLSRTQQLDVYQQLQAGARVLDIRLAINPWLALADRAQQQATSSSSSSSSIASSLVAPGASDVVVQEAAGSEADVFTLDRSSSTAASWASRLRSALANSIAALRVVFMAAAASLPGVRRKHQPAGAASTASAAVFEFDPVLLEGSLNLAAAGGPLTAAERHGCITTSHSLPGAPLVTVLRDVRRFLAENPGELLVLLVKADTIDVNVAGSLRFTSQDWAAAAAVFEQELQGVQLVDEQQVQLLTLGELALGSHGGGSVLLYSSELQQQGLVAVSSKQARILESWGNGTSTEDLGDLKQRLVDWLLFWRSAGWRRNRKPFLLLASAQVTLGVRTILEMVKNRIWHWQQLAMDSTDGKQQHEQRAVAQWQHLLQQHQQQGRRMGGLATPNQGQLQRQQQRSRSVSMLASGMTTLYQLGVETNKEMLEDVLNNNQVPKDFNIWSLDAISPDIVNSIISLNNPPSPTQQE